MTKVTCTRRLTFCAGHRVVGHENKCRHLHGHNYVVEITADAELDSVGRVIDFSVLKAAVGGWIDQHWDHRFIAWEHDAFVQAIQPCERDDPRPVASVYWLPTNPTAENMARHLLEVVCPLVLLGTGVTVTRVRLHETENCYADASHVPGQ